MDQRYRHPLPLEQDKAAEDGRPRPTEVLGEIGIVLATHLALALVIGLVLGHA